MSEKKMSFDDLCLKQLHETLEETGTVRPHLALILNCGRMIYFDFNFNSDSQKDEAKEIIGRTVMAARISGRFIAARFASEAWISRRTAANPLPNLRASEDPEKREGVFLITWEKDIPRHAHFFELNRTADGRASLKEEPGYDEITVWLDRAFEPLPDGPVPELIKKAASNFVDGVFPLFEEKGPNGR
jgi:hypothetical protein